MGCLGCSKKVSPEEEFNAADTDKDGKLTSKELGAMLQAKGVVFSPKRTEMLLGALDENGDGSLELAEFSKGLDKLAAIARALLEQQHPSQPAVAAGVVAVGSRLDKNNYVKEMATWARNPQQLLPKAVLLQANIAAIQAIGPAYLQQCLEQQKIDELKEAVEVLKEADLFLRTRAEYQLAEAIKRKEKAVAKLAEAMARIETVKLTSAEAISPGLARDGERYTEAINNVVADEPGVLDQVSAEAAAMVNVGALKVGDEVEVEYDGAMQRAQVRRVIDQADDGTYELSLWTQIFIIGTEYEAGFDTSQPKLVTLLPRRDIYASTKHKQALSKEARALAAGRAAAEAKASAVPPPSTAPAYLALLYADAERTLPLLHDLGAEINTQQPSIESAVAPLKGEARAAFKTLDKYGGDYSRLTDLARMCAALPAARSVPAPRPHPPLHTCPTPHLTVAVCAWQDGPVQDAQGRQGCAQDARLARGLCSAAHQEPAHARLRRQRERRLPRPAAEPALPRHGAHRRAADHAQGADRRQGGRRPRQLRHRARAPPLRARHLPVRGCARRRGARGRAVRRGAGAGVPRQGERARGAL